jgi:hypothetical protein
VDRKFWYWKYKREGYLEFNRWKGVNVLFSLRDKRESFLHTLSKTSKVISIRQIHSNSVILIDGPGNYVGDGLLTKVPNVWLTISVADCLPIYIYDSKNKVIGLIHAGKKGTQNFILKQALSILMQNLGSTPPSISILFGPSICPKCYTYDLWKNNLIQAKEMGVVEIMNPKICTAEFPHLFYSYHTEKGTPHRMVAAIRLVYS